MRTRTDAALVESGGPAEHRQLSLVGREFDRAPDLRRLEVRLREIASIVRELRSQGAVVLED